MTLDYPHIAGEFWNTPWLIDSLKFDAIEVALLNRFQSGPVAITTMEARRPSSKDIREVKGDVAMIGVNGTLTPRPSIMSSGGASCRDISEALTEALREPEIAAIVMTFNTPGGQVQGVQELGDQIAEAKKVKPIHCVVEHQACSAGYWLASQGSSLSAAPNSMVGSIGVIWKHMSISKSLEMSGVSTTIVTSGRRKGGMSSELPLDDESRKWMQDSCDALYGKFVSAVASGRGVSKEKVMSAEWGEGAAVMADDAMKCGMIDRIATSKDIVDMLRGQSMMRDKAKLRSERARS